MILQKALFSVVCFNLLLVFCVKNNGVNTIPTTGIYIVNGAGGNSGYLSFVVDYKDTSKIYYPKSIFLKTDTGNHSLEAKLYYGVSTFSWGPNILKTELGEIDTIEMILVNDTVDFGGGMFFVEKSLVRKQ